MGASSRSIAVGLILSLAASVLGAQQPRQVEGRVVRLSGSDTLAVADAEVVLHQVGSADQGPIDSVRANRDGRFRIRYNSVSSALYLLSVRHHGIAYFSSPIGRDSTTTSETITLIVADTSAVAPVAIAARSVVITAAEPSGRRLVVEVVELNNRGQRTRSLSEPEPTLRIPLPRGGVGFSIQESDFSGDAIALTDDAIVITAPIPPGQRSILLEYEIPPGRRRVEWPAAGAADTFQVMLGDDGLELTPTLDRLEDQIIEGRSFSRFMGAWPSGIAITLEARGWIVDQNRALVALVSILTVALVGGFLWLDRRRRRAVAIVTPREPPGGLSPAVLMEQIARLDARYQGGGVAVPSEELARYQAERGRLKGLLEAALAKQHRRP